MTDLRKGLPPLPDYMRRLPLDHRGYPVPFFVTWLDPDDPDRDESLPAGEGVPEFRLMNPYALLRCIKENRCWLCGQKMGRYKAFVVGPMCAINKTGSEPPSHTACAEFAVRACPWMLNPKANRRDANLPEHKGMAGIGITRNPGVALVWVTASYKHERAPGGGDGILFRFGPPERLEWWREGREATRAEVDESIQSGLPQLREAAAAQGERAVAEFEAACEKSTPLLPAA